VSYGKSLSDEEWISLMEASKDWVKWKGNILDVRQTVRFLNACNFFFTLLFKNLQKEGILTNEEAQRLHLDRVPPPDRGRGPSLQDEGTGTPGTSEGSTGEDPASTCPES
jgi:hypothetical protein